jgi:hypothetical protein
MRIVIAGFPNRIVWGIRRDDPTQVALEHPAGWSILNPLIEVPNPCNGTNSGHFYALETLLLVNSQLAFVVPSAVDLEEISNVTESVLRRLRFVTKQVGLPTEPSVLLDRNIETLAPSADSDWDRLSAGPRESLVRDFLCDTPVTMEAVRQAGSLPTDFVAPIYDSLLMDAMAALIRHDYRTAILYAAIAVETLSGTLCEAEHQRLFTAVPRSETVRSISSVRSGGIYAMVDPIYRHLVKSNNFSVLLSELPLYVFRRSLLNEDQVLYQRALRLYRTRNSVAHRGQAAGDDVFPVTPEGAISALECAVDVFRWFRVSAVYFIPRGQWRRFTQG